MLSRDTQPLPIIREDILKNIGVIGATAGAGASFICQLLEREKRCGLGGGNENNSSSACEIIDLGESDSKGSLDCVLIVVDCRKEFSDKVSFAVKALRGKGTSCALVLNHWYGEYQVPENIVSKDEGLICFRIPEIKFNHYTDLYNFVFYS